MSSSSPELDSAPAPAEQRSFVRAARRRGVRGKIARLLEPEANALFPATPEVVLTDRIAFEQAAAMATLGDAGNLELSYRRVDALASALERLGLGRASDVPDPFRRVWIENLAGKRKQGVVLRRLEAEIAIFCPPGEDAFWDSGAIMRVSYRSFDTAVDYELKLADAVRLPAALVLHLTRPEATGSIGRDDRRSPVQLEGLMRSEATPEHPDWAHWSPCELHDVSMAGCRATCRVRYEQGVEIDLDLALPDGIEGSVRLRAEVRWVREDRMGGHMHGLQIYGSPAGQEFRYSEYVADVTEANWEDNEHPESVPSATPEVEFESLEAPRFPGGPEEHDLSLGGPFAMPVVPDESTERESFALEPLDVEAQAPEPERLVPEAWEQASEASRVDSSEVRIPLEEVTPAEVGSGEDPFAEAPEVELPVDEFEADEFDLSSFEPSESVAESPAAELEPEAEPRPIPAPWAAEAEMPATHEAGPVPEEELVRQRDSELRGLEQVSMELERTGRELSGVLQASARERQINTEEQRRLQREAAEVDERCSELAGLVEDLESQLERAEGVSGAALDEQRQEHEAVRAELLERTALLEQRLQGLKQNHSQELESVRSEHAGRAARLEERLRSQLAMRRRLLCGFRQAREEAQTIGQRLEQREKVAAAERETLMRATSEQAARLAASMADLDQQREAHARLDGERALLARQVEELKLEVLHHSRWKRKWSGIVRRFTDPGA